jgi:putative endonuclease
MRLAFVYILSNRAGQLYIGVTPNLKRRMSQHRRAWSGYTARHQIKTLVYFEILPREAAIKREKQLKVWKRMKKIDLIESKNPEWKDLTRRIEPSLRLAKAKLRTDSSLRFARRKMGRDG